MSAYQDYISTYNGSPLTYNGSWLSLHVHAPSALAPYTVRFEFANSAYDPTLPLYHWKQGGTWTRVSSSPNVWDFTYINTSWTETFSTSAGISQLPSCAIIDANLRDVRYLTNTFYHQSNFTSINLGDLWYLTGIGGTIFESGLTLSEFRIGDIGELATVNPNANSMVMKDLVRNADIVSIGDIYIPVSWEGNAFADYTSSSITVGKQFATTSTGTMFKYLKGNPHGTVITLGDMPYVTDASAMFFSAGHYTDVQSLDVIWNEITYRLGSMPALENTNNMFYEAYVDVAPNLDLSNVTSADHMFYGSYVTEAPRYNMPNCGNANYMFANCPRLESVPLMHINRYCYIDYLFYSPYYSGLQYTRQNVVDLYMYYCDPNYWASSAVSMWNTLHPNEDPYRYYYDDNSWNRRTSCYNQLGYVGYNTCGNQGVPQQWWNN